MTEETASGKPQRKRAPKAKPQPQPNGHDTSWSAEHNERVARGERIETGRPTDIRAANAERIARGEVIPEDKRKRGDGVINPRDPLSGVPRYLPGQLPKVFEEFVADALSAWPGDAGTYACGFLSTTCGVLHSSVKMNTNPDKPLVLRNPNDHALIFGKSGDNKSGLLRDLMRRQEKWHADAARHRQATSPKGKRGDIGSRVMLQRTSVEGALAQITDNKGERLILTTEEAMGLLKGAGAHRGAGAVDAVNDLMTSTYDGGVYSKRLVGKTWDIPECLGTFTMVGIFDEMANWEGFPDAVRSGAMSRVTVGLFGHSAAPDRTQRIEGAQDRWFDVLDKLHALRNVTFRLSSEATQRWFAFTAKKEAANKLMEDDGERDGLVKWAKKYDMRVMSMAVAFQAIEFVEGGQVDCVEAVITSPASDESKVEEPKIARTVTITEANLVAAAKFVEGYLFEVQRVFYERAAGITEFGAELVNFMAYRLTSDDPSDPGSRVMSRDSITYNGPRRMRGAVTPERKEQHKRWVQALLDHGFVEVYEHPNARKLKVPRKDCEERWFRMRDEFYEAFEGEHRAWAKEHYMASRLGIEAAEKRGPARGVDI